MSSVSPSSDQDRVPPGGQDENQGEDTPDTPPSSPNDLNKLIPGLADVFISDDTDNARGITPGIEGSETEYMVRETADGVSEKEQHTLAQDLDKEIDALLEYNGENGQVYPDSLANIQNINVDTNAGSALRTEIGCNSNGHDVSETKCENNVKVNIAAEKVHQDVGSEKSFTSDTDTSSVFAESVVRKAISNAVDIVKSDKQESEIDRLESEAAVKESYIKVGLFQYHNSEEDDDDVDVDSDGNKEEKNELNDYSDEVNAQPEGQKYTVVGLFQYTDMDREKSPVVSEIDDEGDDIEGQVESLNEEEKTNIFKLYGLEEVEQVSPVSPKSASPSESGPNSFEENDEKKLFDVQRDVYEPSTRHFSVTRDISSNESTPRATVNGDSSEKLKVEYSENNAGIGASINMKSDTETNTVREMESETRFDNLSSETDEGESDMKSSFGIPDTRTKDKDAGDENVVKAVDSNITHSISPPLVQYEPVKENGKFRIVKTTKEGGVSSYSSIRVGADVISPKESPRYSESQKQSNSEIENKEKVQVGTTNKSQIHISSKLSNDKKRERHEENGDEQHLAKHESQQNMEMSKTSDKGHESTQDAIGLDREKIRKLIENETAESRPASSNDTSMSKDSGFPRSQYIDKNEELNTKYKERRSVSELCSPPERERESGISQDSYLSRIRYTTMDTVGREVKRLGPKPYDVKDERDSNMYTRINNEDRAQCYSKEPGNDRDRLHHDREKLQNDRERPNYEWDRPIHERERHMSEDHLKSDVMTNYNRPNSTSYEEELLRRAYDRVSDQSRDKRHTVPAGRSHKSSIIIPGFKTLQDQQAKWSNMFLKIEDEHRMELRSQYDRHQYNIQRLQQQMEIELQKQHLAIRKKLDIHKEALAKMSPDRGSSTRSPDRSLSPERVQRSPDGVLKSPERSKVERLAAAGHSGDYTDLSTLQSTFDSKTWREIYHEVRQEEEQGHSPSHPLKQFLNHDFTDSKLERSRPSGERSSPHGSSDISRSSSRDRSRDMMTNISEKTQSGSRLSKAERDMSLGNSRKVGCQRSPEGRDSRSFERDLLLASFGKESVPPLHLPDGASQDGVSRHVQELLDNLNDSRHSLHDLEDGMTSRRPLLLHADRSSERPRAGVYSSPMPLLSSSRSIQKPSQKLFDSSSTIMDNSCLAQSLPVGHDRAEFYTEQPKTIGARDRPFELLRTDDSCLSPSTRMNLREKHAKHLNDLRTYYEDELRELRKALSDTMDASVVSVNTSLQSLAHDPLLEAENRQLSDKCRMLEDEIEELQKQVRTLEQKNLGIEKRASEYAAAYADSQTLSVQHRAHIEELQRYCRERDDLINELESKMVSNDDSVKIYKKNLDDEIELHRQDKISLQRMMDRYESLETEYKLLQETMSTTENKLYETRTEVVELNRTISKLELENKRLGRENDNLRHKVTQSLNLSTLHESFGSPSSPRDVQNLLSSCPEASSALDASLSTSQPGPTDSRIPSFATSMKDWTPAQKSCPKSVETNRSRTEELNTRQPVLPREKKVSKSRKEEGESGKGRQSEKSTVAKNTRDSSLSSSREDITNRPVRDTTPPRRDLSQPRRELTPTRSLSPSSQAESEVSDYSPLLKAERELFKLRDMMRQAVAVKPSSCPPLIKLQKKFYGSERSSCTDDYTPELGVQRGRKEKPSISSHSSVAKTKSSQSPVKSEKSNSKRQSSSKSEKSSKTKDRERSERGKDKMERENGRQRERTPAKREEHADTSTRFDIDFNETNKSLTLSQRKVENQSGKQKNQTIGEYRDQSKNVIQRKDSSEENYSSQGAEGHVENTLDMIRHGQYTTRPEWENIYTSLAKPKSEAQTLEETVKDRLRSVAEMESRYDGLQVEKRQLESSINKIPLHGRVDRNNRRQKEELENKLDAVERELGSLRMTLKRYNVLKTAG